MCSTPMKNWRKGVKFGSRGGVWLLLAGMLGACGLFKATKELTHAVEEAEKPAKPAPPMQAVPPSTEGPLLDNKVTALRVQEALRKAGTAYGHVEVTGDVRGVTLSGSVRTQAEKEKAEEIAKTVHRKMKLFNELRVGQ